MFILHEIRVIFYYQEKFIFSSITQEKVKNCLHIKIFLETNGVSLSRGNIPCMYTLTLLIWLDWKGRWRKRGEGKLGENMNFPLFGWWKKMKGKEYGVGDFPHEIQFQSPKSERENRTENVKYAITILPFKPCHFLFLSCHFSTAKHKLHKISNFDELYS